MESNYEKYVGAVLDGRYKIEKVIGMGGMAVVFKAEDVAAKKTVAIKLLREDTAQEEESVKRFINESKAVSMLSHPNIVKIYAVSVREDLKYIVMEYIEGITLKSYMQKKGVMSHEEVLKCSGQILCALDHAHSKGIVHRDIKPQNIMLTRTGQVKVTDFGIAKLPNAETVTMTDKAIGTVYYISPEQASGKTIDSRSDLYSLGVTMYEMATGELPFDAESPVSVALMQVNDKPVPPKEINPEIPTGLQQIIGNAMEKDPDERYQSAREMLADISELRKNPRATFKNGNKKVEKTGIKGALSQAIHGNTMLPIILGVIVPFFIILAISALIGISKITDVQSTAETITVDDFIGKNYYTNEALKNALKNSEVYKVKTETRPDSEHEPGYILDQTPSPGDKKKIERGVSYCQLTLIIATSGEASEIPSLIAYDKRDAELELKSRDIQYEIIEVNDDAYDAGQVIKTEPAAGEKLEYGQKLKLYISNGPAEGEIEVPYMLGMTEREALAALQKSGLSLGVPTYQKSDAEAGKVIDQSLAAGTKVAKNAKIDITISGGKNYDPDKKNIGGDDTDAPDTDKKEEDTKAPETTKAPDTTAAPQPEPDPEPTPDDQNTPDDQQNEPSGEGNDDGIAGDEGNAGEEGGEGGENGNNE